MSFSDIYYYLSSYDADKLILSALAFCASLVMKRLVKHAKLKRLIALAPFVCGIALRFLLSLALDADEQFGDILREGVSIGGGATVIYSAIFGILSEKYEDVPIDSFLLEGILAGYTEPDKLSTVAEQCAEIARQCLPEQEECQRLTELLLESTTATHVEAVILVKLIQNVLKATE